MHRQHTHEQDVQQRDAMRRGSRATVAFLGAAVLAAAAQVRIEKGLTCGIDGFPAAGCGDPVKNVSVPAKDDPVQLQIAAPVGSSAPVALSSNDAGGNDSSAWKTIVPVAIIVLLLTGGALVITRRRRAA